MASKSIKILLLSASLFLLAFQSMAQPKLPKGYYLEKASKWTGSIGD